MSSFVGRGGEAEVAHHPEIEGWVVKKGHHPEVWQANPSEAFINEVITELKIEFYVHKILEIVYPDFFVVSHAFRLDEKMHRTETQDFVEISQRREHKPFREVFEGLRQGYRLSESSTKENARVYKALSKVQLALQNYAGLSRMIQELSGFGITIDYTPANFIPESTKKFTYIDRLFSFYLNYEGLAAKIMDRSTKISNHDRQRALKALQRIAVLRQDTTRIDFKRLIESVE